MCGLPDRLHKNGTPELMELGSAIVVSIMCWIVIVYSLANLGAIGRVCVNICFLMG